MTKLLLAAALFLNTLTPGWEHNLSAAKEQAKKEHKLILLNFSGSDWCIPCMRMHQEIFNTEVFTNYAGENLVCVNADFPRRKKNQLSKEQQQQNDALAEQYNNKGAFPYTVLLNEDGKVLAAWDGFYKDSAAKFIQEIKDKGANK
ncbi:MAG: thioredoxin family protein [Ferruginibacter sp.]